MELEEGESGERSCSLRLLVRSSPEEEDDNDDAVEGEGSFDGSDDEGGMAVAFCLSSTRVERRATASVCPGVARARDR